MKRYIGFVMIVVPVAGLLVMVAPVIIERSAAIPISAWVFAVVMVSIIAAWIAAARALLK